MLEKKNAFCTIIEQIQMYGHQPCLVADDAAETDVCAEICQAAAAVSVIKEMRSASELTFHRHLQLSLDWMGQANGLASQITGPHTNGLLPMVPH